MRYCHLTALHCIAIMVSDALFISGKKWPSTKSCLAVRYALCTAVVPAQRRRQQVMGGSSNRCKLGPGNCPWLS
jgi:hypothetical protein